MDLLASLPTLAQSSPESLRPWAYALFLGIIGVFLWLDLGVLHRHAHAVSMREAIAWSIVWIFCGLAFTAFVYFGYERQWLGLGVSTPAYNPAPAGSDDLIIRTTVGGAVAAEQYLTGYIVEKSLAMDNIFVIALIFSFFATPAKYQHRVLFWGILGALVMRGGMILIGGRLIMEYQWILVFFGAFLVLTALKMALVKGHDDVSQNAAVRLIRRYIPVTDFYDGQRFFTRRSRPVEADASTDSPRGRLTATPLFLALVLVEITDLVFAVDSIPAIFAITPDPFIVFTSNIFAILGLRALYFCLAALIPKFRFLKGALILVLAFVGVKLLLLSAPPYLDDFGVSDAPVSPIKVSTTMSLAVIALLLGGSVLLSILFPARPVSVGLQPGSAR